MNRAIRKGTLATVGVRPTVVTAITARVVRSALWPSRSGSLLRVLRPSRSGRQPSRTPRPGASCASHERPVGSCRRSDDGASASRSPRLLRPAARASISAVTGPGSRRSPGSDPERLRMGSTRASQSDVASARAVIPASNLAREGDRRGVRWPAVGRNLRTMREWLHQHRAEAMHTATVPALADRLNPWTR